jgi:hypothetical protein
LFQIDSMEDAENEVGLVRTVMESLSRVARDLLRTPIAERDQVEKEAIKIHSDDVVSFKKNVVSEHRYRIDQLVQDSGQETHRTSTLSSRRRDKESTDLEEDFTRSKGDERFKLAVKIGFELPSSLSSVRAQSLKEVVDEIRETPEYAIELPSVRTATDRSNGINEENEEKTEDYYRIILDPPVLPPFPVVILKAFSGVEIEPKDYEDAHNELITLTESIINDNVKHAREQQEVDNKQGAKQAIVLRQVLQSLSDLNIADQTKQFNELADHVANMGVQADVFKEVMDRRSKEFIKGRSISGFEVKLLDASKNQPPEGPPVHVETFALWSSGIPHDIIPPSSSAASDEHVQDDYMTGAINLVNNASLHHKTIILTNSNLNDTPEFLEAVRKSPGVVEVWLVQHSHPRSYPDEQIEGHREMLSSVMRLILAVTPGWKTIVFRDADSGAHYIEDLRMFEYIRSIIDTNPERLKGLAFVGPTYSVDSSRDAANFNGLMHRSVRFGRYGTLRLSMGRFMLLKQLSEVDLAQMVHHGLLCTGLHIDPESLSAADAEAKAKEDTVAGDGNGDGEAIGDGDGDGDGGAIREVDILGNGESDNEDEGDQARQIEGCKFRQCLARYSQEVYPMTVGTSYSGMRMNKNYKHFQYSCDEKALNLLVADLLYRDASLGGFQIIWHPGFQVSNEPQVTELIYYGNDEIEERLTKVIHEAMQIAQIPK